MGNNTTNVTSADFNPKEWTVTDRQQSQNQAKGNYQILENIKNGELIDEYEMIWPSEEDFFFYLDSYNWRKNQYNIVQSEYIIQQHNEQFCSKTFQAKVYIEHIPTRLSDITDIPYPDNLYVLLSVLQGYQKLFQNLHYFLITEDQICIDKQGTVKVWVNSNLSKNYPESDANTNHDKKDQSHMVQELMNMIWENTDEDSEPSSFNQFFIKKKGKKRIGFDQAKVIVNQYAKNNSSQIPQKFNSILQMRQQSSEFQSDSKETDNPRDEYPFPTQNNTGINVSGSQYPHNPIIMSNNEQSSAHFYHSNTNVNSQMFNSAKNSAHYYHMPTAQINPGLPIRQMIHQANPLNYSHAYSAMPIITRHVSPLRSLPPLVVNQQFIPKSLGNHSGPIISIPAPTRGVRFHLTSNKKFPIHQTLNKHSQILKQNQIQQQENEDTQQKFIIENEDLHLNEESKHLDAEDGYQEHFEKEDVNIFLNNLNNRNQDYEERISTLNMASLTQTNNIPNTNKRDDFFSESQRYSHKNEQNQPFPNNLNRNQYKSDVFEYQSNHYAHANGVENSRNFGNKSHQFDKNSGNDFIKNLSNEDNEIDIKYYTLHQEMQLDQEIAADLKKFIMAT